MEFVIGLLSMSEDEFLCLTSQAMEKGLFFPRHRSEHCGELSRQFAEITETGNPRMESTRLFGRDIIETVWFSDAENKSIAQVHTAITNEFFDRDTNTVGAKRLRLR